MKRMIGSWRSLDLGDHLFEPVLEFSLDPRAGLEQAEVEGAHDDILERGGNVARGDPPRRPSTTAVLPTPASPVRIGLFCRRRIRMSTIWRTSASRPMTGSISPFFATFGQVDRELIEGGRLCHAGRGWACPSPLAPPCSFAAEPSSSLEPAISLIRFGWSRSVLILPSSREASRAQAAQLFVVQAAQATSVPDRTCLA